MWLAGILYVFSIIATVFCVEDENVDESKVVCEALSSTNEASFKVSTLKKPLQYEDVLKMVSWNMKYDLKSGTKEFNLPDVQWRRPILNEIFEMFKLGCPNNFVPHEFVNILKELVMIYYNSLTPMPKDNSATWENMVKVLKECKGKGHKLPIKSNGLMADTLVLNNNEVDILSPEETADSLSGVDIIIDNLWFIFSFSFGSCYSPAGYRSSWAPRYKKQFYDDFIVPFLQRWPYVGQAANFGVIFGNFDLSNILANVRLCVTSAYTVLGVADRQLVRPIKFGKSINRKTGDA